MGVRRRIFALVSLGCLSHLPEARAQSEAGLLLGMASGETLWITPDADSQFHIAAKKSRLLVPRDDGFWWVGTEARCVMEDLREGGVNVERGVWINREEGLFISRAGETAQVDVEGDPCADVERRVIRLRNARGKLAGQADSTESVDELDCGTVKRRVTFVSPTVLSVEVRGMLTEFCSPAKYYTWGTNYVKEFASGNRIALRSILPETEWEKLTKEFSAPVDDEYQESLSSADADTSWIITHNQDKWSAAFWQDGSIAARGGQDLEFTVDVPHQFASDASLPIAFEAIKARFPGVREVFASPSGGYILVREAEAAFIVRVEHGGMSDTMFEVPADPEHGFVMLRWASADEAAKWNAAFPSLSEPEVRQPKQPRQR